MSPHRPVAACTGRPARAGRPARTGRPGRTTAAVVAAGASLALLAGCASATGGTGPAGGGAAAPAAATSSAATPSLTALATRVATAVAAATSVHVVSDLSGVSVLPVRLGTVEGDLALAGGRPTAADVTADGFGLRYTAGTAWVSLPGSPAATPWTLVSPTSSNPLVAMAATRLAALPGRLAGVDPATLLAAASQLRTTGPADVDGTRATGYTFTVDPAAIATALDLDTPAAGGSTGPVPVQMWLDGSDRPVRVTATPTVDGTASAVTVTLSAWDAPVSITAPDPAQVAR